MAYGTKRAGNEALARAVGNGLAAVGHSVDVLAATKVDALDRWDAVVVGGARHAWFWQPSAMRFIKRDVEDLFAAQPPLIIQLVELPRAPLEPVKLVEKPVEPPGTLIEPAPPAPRALTQPVRGTVEGLVHRLVLWLCLFSGVTAVAGGVSLLGGYFVPGLILLLVVGVGNLAAAALEARQTPRSELAVSVAGAALTGWIVTQLVMLRSVSWLQLIFFGVGVSTVLGAIWLWRARHRLHPAG